MLREAKVDLFRGLSNANVAKKLGITDQTYYPRRKENGGMKVDQARRLKEFEQENARLKHMVADLSLNNAILEGAARRTF